MALFAEVVPTTKKVIIVFVIADSDLLDGDGVSSEATGIAFCQSIYGTDSEYVQTADDDAFPTLRGNRAQLDQIWQPELGGGRWPEGRFAEPQPYDSWTQNDEGEWEAPVARISGYQWDEATLAWVRPEPPYPSWVWNEIGHYDPPTPKPEIGNHDWNEETQAWDAA